MCIDDLLVVPARDNGVFEAFLAQLNAVCDKDTVLGIIVPTDHRAFDGFKSERDIKRTIKGRLLGICNDKRWHREISADCRFSIRDVVVPGIADALITLARGEGWDAEAGWACLRSNVSCHTNIVWSHFA